MANRMIAVLLVAFIFTTISFAESPGKDLFASKCAICHGPNGSGDTAMGKKWKVQDLRAPEVQKQSNAELKAIIAKGKNKMPAYEDKLTSEQIDQLVGWIKELGNKK